MVWTGAIFLVTALFSAFPTPEPGGPAWQWPLRPQPVILRPFDPPAHPWEAGHRGTDLAARPGQPVYAAGPGRVGFAQDLAGRGVITVIHGRSRTTYLPVRPSVHAGQVVAAGARIGVVEEILGHCGQSTCLHWGLRQGVDYFDPLTLLGLGPVRLLPWWHDLPEQAEPPGSYRAVDRGGPLSPAVPGASPLPGAVLPTRPSPAGALPNVAGALDPARHTELSSTPASTPPGDSAPSHPADRRKRPSLPYGATFAIAAAGEDPVSRFALLADALATLTVTVFRAHRSSDRHHHRRAPGWP
jgi:hypothetical protein